MKGVFEHSTTGDSPHGHTPDLSRAHRNALLSVRDRYHFRPETATVRRADASTRPPRDARIEPLRMEVTLHRLGGEIADLHTARAIVSAHLDADFKARAAAAARRLFWDEGLLGRIDNKGWEDTTVQIGRAHV